mgnify:FL=1
MIIIRNKFIPFPGFKALNFLGILFVRGNAKITERTLYHERIHSRQIIEVIALSMLPLSVYLHFGGKWFIGALFSLFSYYIWYVIEWVIHLMMGKGKHEAYRSICFENEAYSNDTNFEYLKNRNLFNFFDYIKL